MALALCMTASTACSESRTRESSPTPTHEDNGTQAEQKRNNKKAVKEGKALVIFFSHAGDNYAVGNIKVGNTKIVADYITELTGADQFEIRTNKYDGIEYRALCDLAKQEQKDGLLPPFEGKVDMSGYATVFVGGPVWWGTYPQVMFSFFKKYDLAGKNVIPFTTHEGSGLGRCVDDLRKACPKANVGKGFAIYGHDVREGKETVKKWLKQSGF